MKCPRTTRTITFGDMSVDFICGRKFSPGMSNRNSTASSSEIAKLLICALQLRRGSLLPTKHIVISLNLSVEYPWYLGTMSCGGRYASVLVRCVSRSGVADSGGIGLRLVVCRFVQHFVLPCVVRRLDMTEEEYASQLLDGLRML